METADRYLLQYRLKGILGKAFLFLTVGDQMIKLEHVFIKKGIHNIVNDLNWTIHSGEHWLLFGLNGSGKTTLLSMIAAYQSPSRGKMYLDERAYDASDKYAVRAKIGFASTSFFDHYFSKETVLDIVLSGFGSGLGLNDAIGPVEVSQAKRLLACLLYTSWIIVGICILTAVSSLILPEDPDIASRCGKKAVSA